MLYVLIEEFKLEFLPHPFFQKTPRIFGPSQKNSTSEKSPHRTTKRRFVRRIQNSYYNQRCDT